ncbi:MAG: ATP-binding protein [Candidatus Methanoperedens sp.]|nr:ATP-binding protein [Candidatus Methanoperedens sp.]
MVGFINRKNEIRILEDIYNSNSSSLVVIYGRRRVGKTELSREFIKGKKAVYIFIEIKPEAPIFKDIEESLGEILKIKPRIESWDDFFNLIFEQKEKLIIVFDEFQNLSKVNPGIFSKFQKYWDLNHNKSQHMFLIIGSYVGMIKKIFKDTKEPLFGRATMLFNIKPFNFFDSFTFLNAFFNLEIENASKFYFIFGGVPKYLLLAGQMGTDDPVETFKKLFIDTRILAEEGKNILTLEFGSEHRSFFSILEAISSGNATPKEISDYTGLQPGAVSKYLYELVNNYEIVIREKPVIMSRVRDTRYFLLDNFFNFWFRFIYRNSRLLEINPEKAFELIMKDINSYFGKAFEKLAVEFLVEMNRKGSLHFEFMDIGRWWHRNEEIDIITLNKEKKEISFFECKWSSLNAEEAEIILAELKRKATLVKWYNARRKERYGIIAKDIEDKEELKGMGYIVFDLRDFAPFLLQDSQKD